MDWVQTTRIDEDTDIHLDYLNDTKIWADWIACIVLLSSRANVD